MAKIVSGKSYMLVNATSLTAMTLRGGSGKEQTPVEGQPIQINAGNNAYQNATWTFNAVDQTAAPIWYKITNRAGGTLLSTAGGANTTGTKLVGTKDPSSFTSQWMVTEVTGQTASCYVLTNRSAIQGGAAAVCVDLNEGQSTAG